MICADGHIGHKWIRTGAEHNQCSTNGYLCERCWEYLPSVKIIALRLARKERANRAQNRGEG